MGPSYYEFEPLGFTECACTNQAFDRFKSPRRVNLESRILLDIFKNRPNKDQPINLLSMGCGGLLQDWIVIGHLLKEGYKNINITLVDPELNSKKLQQFTDFFKTAKAENISISHFDTIDKVEDHLTFDAIMAIDFDELLDGKETEPNKYRYGWEDIITAQRKLEQHGGLYLGQMQEDFVINADNKIEILGKPGIHSAISKDIKQCKEKVSIAASQCMIAVPMLLPVITKLVEVGLKEVFLTLVGEDDKYGFYPNVQAVENIINGFVSKNVSVNINYAGIKLDSKQKFNYVVTGEHEDITENKAAVTSLLSRDGVVYLFRNLAFGHGAIDKLTKSSESRLLKM